VARVCFISEHLDIAVHEGPHQRAVRWLAPALASRGIEVDVVASGAAAGNDNLSAELSPARVFLLGASRVRFAIKAFRRYLARERPDICIGLVPGLNLLAFITRMGMRNPQAIVPWEATTFAYDLPWFNMTARLAYPALIRRFYPQATAILGASTDCIDTLTDLGVRLEGVRTAVVPYPIDVKEVEEWSRLQAPDIAIVDWRYLIVASGRLHPHKGHDVLLEAVAQLRLEGLDVGVIVVGEGPARGNLESLVHRLDLTDHALLPGHIRPPQRLYGRATVFAHPSRWEGFGMSLLEAMAMGAPVVATSCPGGPKEILDGGRHGLLVPPDDVPALARAIASLICNEDARLEMARRARLRADDYAPTVVAGALVDAIAPYLS
jgi:glycosyltransferase involved in cell wall biosynthesis